MTESCKEEADRLFHEIDARLVRMRKGAERSQTVLDGIGAVVGSGRWSHRFDQGPVDWVAIVSLLRTTVAQLPALPLETNETAPQHNDPADTLFRWRAAHIGALCNAMGGYSHAVPVKQVERDAVSAIDFAKAHGWERKK